MSEEGKYKKCQNCHQDIPESKMFLHEGFCLRNNKFCAQCEKVFLVQEFEEHLKTHNEKKPHIEKQTPISHHRENCLHKKKEPIPKVNKPPVERPKIKPRVIDDNLGLKLCEFCVNMVEDLPDHLKNCKAKKMIEEENEKYYKDLEKRNKEDDDLAKKLAKEKIMDISKDEQMARKLQNDLKPIIDTSKDEAMARDLQRQFKPNIDTSKDEEMARNLQSQFGRINNTSNDERMASELHQKFGNFNINTNQDEQLARMLQEQESRRRNNPGP